jgi:hypothetical protein
MASAGAASMMNAPPENIMAIDTHLQQQEQDQQQKPASDPGNEKTAKPEDAVTDKNGETKPSPEKEPDPEFDISDNDAAA